MNKYEYEHEDTGMPGFWHMLDGLPVEHIGMTGVSTLKVYFDPDEDEFREGYSDDINHGYRTVPIRYD